MCSSRRRPTADAVVSLGAHMTDTRTNSSSLQDNESLRIGFNYSPKDMRCHTQLLMPSASIAVEVMNLENPERNSFETYQSRNLVTTQTAKGIGPRFLFYCRYSIGG